MGKYINILPNEVFKIKLTRRNTLESELHIIVIKIDANNSMLSEQISPRSWPYLLPPSFSNNLWKVAAAQETSFAKKVAEVTFWPSARTDCSINLVNSFPTDSRTFKSESKRTGARSRTACAWQHSCSARKISNLRFFCLASNLNDSWQKRSRKELMLPRKP